MKIIIEGDINKKDLQELGKFLVKRWRGRKDHINVLIYNTDLSLTETASNIREMFK